MQGEQVSIVGFEGSNLELGILREKETGRKLSVTDITPSHAIGLWSVTNSPGRTPGTQLHPPVWGARVDS